MKDLEELKLTMRTFAADRDWDQFHSPKNLVMAMSVEVAELVEHFQWLTEAQSSALDADAHKAAAEEIADVQIYLVRIADKLGIDILDATRDKLVKNAEKYPVAKARGNARKYTSLDS